MNDGVIHREKDGVPYFVFPALQGFPEISHAVFTRHGGVSPGTCSSLNIGRNVGDEPENVAANKSRMARLLDARELVFLRQVHGPDVVHVEPLPEPPEGGLRQIEDRADAMVTTAPGVFLAMTVADCQPLLLYDPIRKVVAAAHSGWRGSLVNVAGATVRAMEARHGTNPADVVACVGPSLGPCCAEFVNYEIEIPSRFRGYRVGEHHFDFWKITRDQLRDAGLEEDNIHVAGVCTRCRTDLFFSYRQEKFTGRFAAVIGVREPK
ncbi:MAG: peptidoglycan editing factor PgeF [Desulfatibacillaceae bacterium]